jgi:ribonuclease III
VPEYVVVSTTGEAHAQAFDVECRIAALKIVATGRGSSRRAAEQAAADAALARIEAGDGLGR